MGTSFMAIGVRAMEASQAALTVTGSNIANANTPGYSRQQLVLTTAGGQYPGGGFTPKGVAIDTITRSHNDFLTREVQLSASQAAADQTRSDQLKRLENAFPMGEAGIGYAASQMLNGFVDVANNPQDLSARQVVLARTQDFAARLGSSAQQLNDLQQGVVTDLTNSAATVNQLTAKVADLNAQIAATQGTGHDPNDLLDQRDQLVKQISQYVQVTTIPADDGSMGLFVAGGQPLVLGAHTSALTVTPDTFDPARAALSVVVGSQTRPLSAASLGAGSMAGLLTFQNEDLVDARNQLGQLGAATAWRVNQQQSFGLDLRQPPGSGQPLLSSGQPRVLPASTNAKDAAGNFIGAPSISITDGTQLQASEYELQSDPTTAGQYLLKRMSDGQVTTVTNGSTVDGFTINIGSPAPAAGDRFLLQPVTMVAQQISAVMTDPRGIAAASPVTASVGASNTGTASVASLKVVSSSLNPALTANISFTSGSGAYNWDLRDSTGAVVSSGTGTWVAGRPIALNGFELQLNGVPASGDTVQVAPTQFPASSNGNALALSSLADEAFVGRTLQSTGTLGGGQSVTGAYAQAIADVGVRVQSAQSASDVSGAAAKAAVDAQQSVAGVNLDEEASRLIQFQQSYQAAAKVLQVAQTVFDTLLHATGQ